VFKRLLLTFVFTLLLFSPLSATRYPVVTKQDIGARVFNDANITVSNNTLTNLTFNQERYDTDSMHSTSSNTDRLTINTAGKYHVGVVGQWVTDTVGRRQICIYLNETTFIGCQGWDTNQNAEVDFQVSTVWDFVAGDFVVITVFHTEGGNLDIVAFAALTPEVYIQRIDF